jgi:hypothetical protein
MEETNAQVAGQAIKNLLHLIRLADEVVHARRHNPVAFFLEHRGGQGGDFHRRPAFQRSDALRRFQTIHDRHPHVHPDEMRLPDLKRFDAEQTVFGHAHREADPFQQPL